MIKCSIESCFVFIRRVPWIIWSFSPRLNETHDWLIDFHNFGFLLIFLHNFFFIIDKIKRFSCWHSFMIIKMNKLWIGSQKIGRQYLQYFNYINHHRRYKKSMLVNRNMKLEFKNAAYFCRNCSIFLWVFSLKAKSSIMRKESLKKKSMHE